MSLFNGLFLRAVIVCKIEIVHGTWILARNLSILDFRKLGLMEITLNRKNRVDKDRGRERHWAKKTGVEKPGLEKIWWEKT